MRTTVSIADPLLENAKRVAEARGVTLSEVIEDALRGHLGRRAPQSGKPFRLPTVRGKLVQPRLNLDRTSELVAADDERAYGRKRR